MKKVLSILGITVMMFLSSCDKSGPVDGGKNYNVQPTWGEAFHYANKAVPSQVPFTIIGIALMLGGIFILAKLDGWKKAPSNPIGIVIAVWVICFAGGLSFLLAKPSGVRMDNVKIVDKEYFDRVGQTYILDSLFESNHMIKAAVK